MSQDALVPRTPQRSSALEELRLLWVDRDIKQVASGLCEYDLYGYWLANFMTHKRPGENSAIITWEMNKPIFYARPWDRQFKATKGHHCETGIELDYFVFYVASSHYYISVTFHGFCTEHGQHVRYDWVWGHGKVANNCLQPHVYVADGDSKQSWLRCVLSPMMWRVLCESSAKIPDVNFDLPDGVWEVGMDTAL